MEMIRHQDKSQRSDLTTETDYSEDIHTGYKVFSVTKNLPIFQTFCVNMKVPHNFFCTNVRRLIRVTKKYADKLKNRRFSALKARF
jgi:phenylalanyl-tRNA synthetase beta subunit